MSNTILVIGRSGSGKSSSLRNLDSESTFIISVLDKPLPFKGYKKHYIPLKSWEDEEGNYFATDDWQKINKCIQTIDKNRPEITTLVIDDIQYVLANEFMKRSAERGYDKYSEMGMHYWSIINTAMSCRSNLLTFFLSHNEIDSNGQSKVKTIGKMLDEKITIEGLFTTVLHTQVDDGKYQFLTQSDGMHNAKSPLGMFENQLIENDLAIVIDKVNEYFN
jgi:AAA domain